MPSLAIIAGVCAVLLAQAILITSIAALIRRTLRPLTDAFPVRPPLPGAVRRRYQSIGLGLISLPLWIFPPLWPAIPVAILGWVNQRLLRYDALAEHADADEMARLYRGRRGALYVLGLLFALAAYVPLVGFFAPVVFGLAFIHYLLGALERDYRRNAA